MSDTVVFGLSFVPDATDVENVKRLILDGDVEPQQFELFCLKNGLSPDQNAAKSAAYFLAFVCGQPLAWLHFPHTSSGRDMAKKVFAWATQTTLIITRGQWEPPLSEEEILQLWSN